MISLIFSITAVTDEPPEAFAAAGHGSMVIRLSRETFDR
jgi:hypothetical protein